MVTRVMALKYRGPGARTHVTLRATLRAKLSPVVLKVRIIRYYSFSRYVEIVEGKKGTKTMKLHMTEIIGDGRPYYLPIVYS